MEQIKKSRSINWSENEKKVLKMLILERAEVLENKDSTTKTIQLKKHAWREVLSRFNAFVLTKRDLPQLQNQWRNMKNRAKSKFEYKSSQKRTGGGPPPPSPPLEGKTIMETLEFVDSNVFYSDSFHNQEPKDEESSVVTPIPDEQGSSLDHKSHVLMLDLVKNKPEILPTQPEKNKAKKNEIHNKRCCPDDHEQAMHYQKEEHEKKMNILALEEKYRKNKTQAMHYEKEEHEKKMNILALEEKYWQNKSQAMHYQKEEHEKKMNILALEEKYWKNKTSNI